MRVCERFVRALMVVAVAYGMLSVNAEAQTSPSGASATVSPTDLSFGVPTGTPVVSPATFPQSAPQTVTVNIQGQGTVTFGVVGTTNNDFAINGNSCTGMLTAPTTCQVSVVFNASAAPANTLETATLTIASDASPATLSVPMNGAYGAIELFGALNINPSLFSGTTWPGSFGKPVSSTTVALSCTAPIVATLSSTPDGNNKVFQDNTIRFVDTPASSGSPVETLNVCRNGDTQFGGFSHFPAGTTNCFQPAYEHDVNNYPGQNPDLAQFPLNQGGVGSFIANYGVPVIDVSSLLVSGKQAVTVELDDAGGELGAASLHLVTNCTLAGVVPGGSITGNPVTKNNPTSQTQTFAFDTGGGQNISFTTSTQTAQSAGTVTVPDGTVPIVTDIGIPQQLFSQLVAGTSAAPAVCLRLTGETDSFNNAMCKGYLIQCQSPSGTVSGDNCVPTASSVRNLLDITRFESPDAAPNTNFLGTACQFATGSNCAATVLDNTTASTLIGPGLLLGSDGWLCAPGATLTTCKSQEPTTQTANDPNHPVYTAANCVLTGSIATDLCPLDTLTEFLGAADPVHGSTTTGKNSIFVPVVNMPLPFSTITSSNINGNGWANTGNVMVNFSSNAANYSAATPIPNGFAPAPPYSFTYGVALATATIPDTTFPVPGDTTNLNPNGANPKFGPPLCGANTPLTFPTNASFGEGPGVYTVHYFTTDCAMAEELVFNPTMKQQKDPNANWASFRTLSFGVDTVAPILTCNQTPTGPNAGSHGWYTTNVSLSCSATDENSGFSSSTTPIASTNGTVLQGALATTLTTFTTGVTVGTANPAVAIPAQIATDLAGNNATQPASTISIDESAPSITAKYNVSGTTFSVGQNVNVTLTCKDTGSGVASCGGQPVSCSTAPTLGSASFTVSNLPIDTTAASIGSHTFNAVDCAGNPSGSISYTVAFGSAELAIATLPNSASVKSGNNLTYKTFVLNIGPNAASNVVVINTLPSNSTYVSAISGIVSCTLAGCNDLTTGSMCSVSATAVTCTTPTIKPILSGLSGFVIKLVVKVSAPASVKSITDTATVSSSNPDPIKGDNTATVTTKVTQ
jgi:uncharacterized repeat protein (TIGR01451 family)